MTARLRIDQEQGFTEVADRCWVARYEFLDVNVGLVGGDRGLLVVDTSVSEAEAGRVVEQLRSLGAGEVVAVVNTHEHFDHCFGNVVFSEAFASIGMYAHEAAAEGLRQSHQQVQQAAATAAEEPRTSQVERRRQAEVAATRVVVPDRTFSSARVIDLGDRLVELVHPGRGHTAGDAVVRVPDVDLLFAGDLVEESAATYPDLDDGLPAFGTDSYPLEWPATLDLVTSMLTESSVVVPGHGGPVDRDFATEQRASIGAVAQTIRSLAEQGVPVSEALAVGEWPYPREHLVHAVTRGYEHLPRSARSLPLL